MSCIINFSTGAPTAAHPTVFTYTYSEIQVSIHVYCIPDLCVCLSETYKTKYNLSSGQWQMSLRDALPKTFFLLLRTYLVIYLVKQGTKEKVFG